MRTLAIETSSQVCSVALFDGDVLVSQEAGLVGRGHAERLVPMIAALSEGGRADCIRVGCGPGSFTGIRVGIAAARALAFGWQISVSGYSSLRLIAAAWFAQNDGQAVTVAIEGGHGQLFVQPFARPGCRETAALSVVSRDALGDLSAPVAGNAVDAGHTPQAANVMLLPDALLAARPIYGRAPDAKPMAT